MKSPMNVNLGLTWQHRGGFFAGAGWTWRANMSSRDEFLPAFTNGAGDRMDIVGRIGYHPGVRVYAPPPPAAASAAAAGGAAEPPAHGPRALPAVHGGCRRIVNGERRRAGSGWRRADLRVERAGRFAHQRVRRADAVDGADGRKGRCR